MSETKQRILDIEDTLKAMRHWKSQQQYDDWGESPYPDMEFLLDELKVALLTIKELEGKPNANNDQ